MPDTNSYMSKYTGDQIEAILDKVETLEDQTSISDKFKTQENLNNNFITSISNNLISIKNNQSKINDLSEKQKENYNKLLGLDFNVQNLFTRCSNIEQSLIRNSDGSFSNMLIVLSNYALQEDLDNAVKDISTLSTGYKTLNVGLDDVISSVNDLDRRTTNNSLNINTLTNKINIIEGENSPYAKKTDLTSINEAIQERIDTDTTQSEQIEILTTTISNFEETVATLQSTIETLTARIEALEKNNTPSE